MKKILAIAFVALIAVALAAPGSYAQNAFQNNEMVLSGGIGFGQAGIYGSMTTPPIFVMLEKGVADKITIGGLVGYSGSSDEFGFGKWTYTNITISARGSYHFLENNKNIDAYAGLGLGYVIVSSSVTWNDPTYNNLYGNRFSASGSWFFYDVHLGARYYFSPKFAALGEVGYGLGFLRLGVSYKLN